MKIWVNGCFDIIHSGHIELLEYAKSLGDYLIVGLDDDERVRESKGKHRPIQPLEERMKIISFNDSFDLESEIYRRNVDIMVVGEEYRNKEVIGSNFSPNVEFFKRIEGKSTTNIVGRILEEYCKEKFYDNT